MSYERGQDHDGLLEGFEQMTEPRPEIKKTFFVAHIGTVTVNNYGAVEFEANVQTPVGYEVREGQAAKIVAHADTINEIARGVRQAISEMRHAGEYER